MKKIIKIYLFLGSFAAFKSGFLLYFLAHLIFFSLYSFSYSYDTSIQMDLASYLYDRLRAVPKVRIYGPAPKSTVHRAPLCSFNVENIHPTDIATLLDEQVLFLFH